MPTKDDILKRVRPNLAGGAMPIHTDENVEESAQQLADGMTSKSASADQNKSEPAPSEHEALEMPENGSTSSKETTVPVVNSSITIPKFSRAGDWEAQHVRKTFWPTREIVERLENAMQAEGKGFQTWAVNEGLRMILDAYESAKAEEDSHLNE